MFLRIFVLLLLLSLLYSCGKNTHLFLDDQDIEMRSLSPGDWVSQGELLPLELLDLPGKLDYEVRGSIFQDDRQVWTGVMDPRQQQGFTLDMNLPQGEYQLEYQVLQGNRLLREDSIPFFFHRGDYTLRDIQLFPPLISPGSRVTAMVEFQASQVIGDPWIVWTLAGEVKQQAFYSEEGCSFHFEATEKTGVYPLEVDVYPGRPMDWEGHSPFRKRSDLLISWGERTVQRRLNSSNSILYSLFDGTMDLHSLAESPLPLDIRDRYMVEFSFRSGMPGAVFRPRSYIDFDGLAMPVKNGELLSHSHSFFLYLEEAQEDQREILFTSRSPGDGISLSLVRTGNELIASLGWDSDYHRVSFPLSEEDLHRPLVVSLGLQAADENWTMTSYLDGQYLQSTHWEAPIQGIVGGGETIIGVPGEASGFNGSLFSWMVYSREEKNQYFSQQDIFHRVAELDWGDQLVFAEGFDSPRLNEQLETSVKRVLLDSSQIILGSEDSLVLPPFLLEDGTYIFDLNYLSLRPPKVRLILGEDRRVSLPYLGGILKLEIQGGRIKWQEPQGFSSFYLPDAYENLEGRIELEAVMPTTLDSILIYKE